MPIIRIDFDDKSVSESEITQLAQTAQKIVSEVTGIEDVFVYANSSRITYKIAPIEIFIEMSAHKIKDQDKLIDEIKVGLANWKKAENFNHPVNLTLIPMQWKIEIAI